MFGDLARVETLHIAPGRRILVTSDIHGNLPYFKGLLEKTGFGDGDELVIDGDFLEKGEQSLETLRYIMRLSRRGNVHTVCGNCDSWDTIFDPRYSGGHDEYTLEYLRRKRRGLLWDMCQECGVDPFVIDCLDDAKATLKAAFPEEWGFISALPHAIEAGNFIFAHAAADPSKPLREHTAHELKRCDRFRDLGYSFDRWLIVGHYPVVLYGENTVCANPIIDRERRIISIDGGCVLKDDGQLNALIIPGIDSEDFTFEAYDAFPVRRVLRDQQGGGRSYYIRWGDSMVQVLERGEEFSRCRHVRTGYKMDILTKYLFTDREYTECNDCTDYALPLRRGDLVSVVETTSRGYFVKHGGVSGWYYGELE